MTVPIDRTRAALLSLVPLAAVLLGLAILQSPEGTDLFSIELPIALARIVGGAFMVLGLAGAAQLIWQAAFPDPGVEILDDEIVVRAGIGRTRRIAKRDIESVSITRGWPEVLTVRAANQSTVSIPMFLLGRSQEMNAEELAQMMET